MMLLRAVPRKLVVLVILALMVAPPSEVLGESHDRVPKDFSCADVTQIPQSECEALVALYNSTDGPNWTFSSGWLDTVLPCTWFGVTCGLGHVTELSLVQNQLVGTLPESIGDLPNLKELDLKVNQLAGELPATLGNLLNLLELDVQFNQLSGPLPDSIGNLAQLRYLYLPSNQFDGSLPDSIGNLVNLQALVLADNQFSGPLPDSIGNLAQLVVFSVAFNQFSGPVPEAIGDMASANPLGLAALELDNNLFHGPLPASVMNHQMLIQFFFHSTDLCEPPDPAFQAWLASIPGVQGTEILCQPGDCNYDHQVDAGDISASVLEIFDGDGSTPAATYGGTFPGNALCDANEDGTVDAGDISCTVLLIFSGPGACAAHVAS